METPASLDERDGTGCRTELLSGFEGEAVVAFIFGRRQAHLRLGCASPETQRAGMTA